MSREAPPFVFATMPAPPLRSFRFGSANPRVRVSKNAAMSRGTRGSGRGRGVRLCPGSDGLLREGGRWSGFLSFSLSLSPYILLSFFLCSLFHPLVSFLVSAPLLFLTKQAIVKHSRMQPHTPSRLPAVSGRTEQRLNLNLASRQSL